MPVKRADKIANVEELEIIALAVMYSDFVNDRKDRILCA